jgi:hypothetical protein
MIIIRLPWWLWTLLGLLAVVAISVLSLRAAGRSSLAALQRDLASRGWPTDAASFIANAPPIDTERQARLRAVLKRPTAWGNTAFPAPRLGDVAEARLSAAEIAALDARLNDGAADAAALGAILDEGPVCITMFGAIERDPKRLAAMTIGDVYSLQSISLLTSRAYNQWWSHQAVRSADPTTHLAHLDAWQRAADRPCSLIDAMIGMATSAIRDETYLYLAVRGRLSNEQLTAWIDESSPQQRWAADGLAGERCLAQTKIYELSPVTASSLGLGSLGGAIAYYPFQHHEAAYAMSSLANSEAALRHQLAVPVRPIPFGLTGLLSSVALPESTQAITVANIKAFTHRLVRIAGLLGHRYRAKQALPDDATALAALLAPGALDARSADEPAIVYERLSSSRFRIGEAAATVVPPGAPTTATSTIGAPASAKAADVRAKSIELDLDAILVPPPAPPAKP